MPKMDPNSKVILFFAAWVVIFVVLFSVWQPWNEGFIDWDNIPTGTKILVYVLGTSAVFTFLVLVSK